MHALKAKCIKS